VLDLLHKVGLINLQVETLIILGLFDLDVEEILKGVEQNSIELSTL
jgi:hypothetical protein